MKRIYYQATYEITAEEEQKARKILNKIKKLEVYRDNSLAAQWVGDESNQQVLIKPEKLTAVSLDGNTDIIDDFLLRFLPQKAKANESQT